MSTATDLLETIQEAGASIWRDGDRLKFQGLPAGLIPRVREHKADLLELLSPDPAPASPPDNYALAEREAIQWESELPPLEPQPDIPGFEDMPDLTAAQHGVIVRQCMDDATPAPNVQHKPAMAPQRVTCPACARFQPGPQPLAIGRCLATDNGLPPSPKQRDYKAAFPMAERYCHEYQGVSA